MKRRPLRKAINDAVFTTEVYKVEKADGRTLLYGFAACDTVGGKAYFDLQGDHLPGPVLEEAALDYAKYSRVVLYEHDGEPVGKAVFVFPLTEELAAELGIESGRTGILVGLEVDKQTSDAYDAGLIAGFSIGGMMVKEGDEVTKLWIDEISVVSRPAQEPATIDSVDPAVEPPDIEFDFTEKRCVKRLTTARALSLSATESTVDPEEHGMTKEEQAKLEAAEKRAKEAEAKLADAEKERDELKADAAKSDPEPAVKAAPKVVYKSLDGGQEYTESDDARLVEMAKRLDAQTIKGHQDRLPNVNADIVADVVRAGREDGLKQLEQLNKSRSAELRAVSPQWPNDPNAPEPEAAAGEREELQKSHGDEGGEMLHAFRAGKKEAA